MVVAWSQEKRCGLSLTDGSRFVVDCSSFSCSSSLQLVLLVGARAWGKYHTDPNRTNSWAACMRLVAMTKFQAGASSDRSWSVRFWRFSHKVAAMASRGWVGWAATKWHTNPEVDRAAPFQSKVGLASLLLLLERALMIVVWLLGFKLLSILVDNEVVVVEEEDAQSLLDPRFKAKRGWFCFRVAGMKDQSPICLVYLLLVAWLGRFLDLNVRFVKRVVNAAVRQDWLVLHMMMSLLPQIRQHHTIQNTLRYSPVMTIHASVACLLK